MPSAPSRTRRTPRRARSKRAPAVRASPPGIADDAVRRATGKGWAHWHAVLDRFDVRANGHKASAAHLLANHGVPMWWSQMLVVGHERVRGIRAVNQRPAGFGGGVSRTLPLAARDAFDAWRGEAVSLARTQGFAVLSQRPPRVVRLKRRDNSRVQIQFLAKGAGRCQVVVDHERLASAAAVTRAKALWRAVLARIARRAGV